MGSRSKIRKTTTPHTSAGKLFFKGPISRLKSFLTYRMREFSSLRIISGQKIANRKMPGLLSGIQKTSSPPFSVLHAQTGREQEGKPDLLLVETAFHTGKGCSLLSDVGGHVGEKVNILSMVFELLSRLRTRSLSLK